MFGAVRPDSDSGRGMKRADVEFFGLRTRGERSLGAGSTRVLYVLPDQIGRDVCVVDEALSGGGSEKGA